jgi:anaerobic nitric oxide reductase transcription regulator
MTIRRFCEALVPIISDLGRDVPQRERFQRLLAALRTLFPCDAVALLRLQGETLLPLAIDGLGSDTLGRRFNIDQPRLQQLLLAREPVRFAADSALPDPYDGLIDVPQPLHVHDCMGASLYVDNRLWGLLTLDALQPGAFNDINMDMLIAFLRITEASIKASLGVAALQERMQREHAVARTYIEHAEQPLLAESAAMNALLEETDRVAATDLTVLIQGETGVGKELLARRVHQLSKRRDEMLVSVNCAALPENLAESELFGHIKGAFSGALRDRAGKFELADGGTLFLDEIGELPLALQAKLLRALQSGELQRLGSDKLRRVDVRVVAATNRDLKVEVAAGRFRADLYHRLCVYPLWVPPLRERREDIPLLCGHFLTVLQRRFGLHTLRLSHNAQQALLAYDWPGNVRELEHVLSRAALRASQDKREQPTITIQAHELDVNGHVVQITQAPRRATKTNALPLRDAVDAFQRELIAHELQQASGNQAQVAARLGIDRSNLSRLMKRLGL